MNKFFRYMCMLAVGVVFAVTSAIASPLSVKQDINWKEFIGRQDMIWETLPEYWYESAYMGNGRLGLMIYNPARITSGWKPEIAMCTTTVKAIMICSVSGVC